MLTSSMVHCGDASHRLSTEVVKMSTRYVYADFIFKCTVILFENCEKCWQNKNISHFLTENINVFVIFKCFKF